MSMIRFLYGAVGLFNSNMIRLKGYLFFLSPFKLHINISQFGFLNHFPSLKPNIFCLSLFLFPTLAIAQGNSMGEKFDRKDDSLSYIHAIENIGQVYKYRLGENSKIYCGSEFISPNKAIKGSPFIDDEFLDTDIFFEDILFQKVPSRLNLVTGQLVIQDYYKKNLIEISRQKVLYFIRNQRLFVRMVSDSDLNRNLKEGIYERIWNKKISMYVFREKISGNVSGVGVFENAFIEYDHYFIKINQRFYPCDDINSFIKLIPDHKNELREFVRNQKQFHKLVLETALLSLVSKYSEL